MAIGDTNETIEVAEMYLDDCGGSVGMFRSYILQRQRLGQAFFNALSDADKERLRGTIHDPFYQDNDAIWRTIEFLLT